MTYCCNYNYYIPSIVLSLQTRI